MYDKVENRVDPFASNPPPCPYAAEGDCPLVKEASRGLGHISLITLGQCSDCPGYNEVDLWGRPRLGTAPIACRPSRI